MGLLDWLKQKISGSRSVAPVPAPRQQVKANFLQDNVDTEHRPIDSEVQQFIKHLGLQVNVTTIERNQLAWGMDYPAVASHPSLGRGNVMNYDVQIERIDYRVEKKISGEEVLSDWTFRGESRCHEDDAIRQKTFFASKCGYVVDGKTGEILNGSANIAIWLQRIGGEWMDNKKKAERAAAIGGRVDGIMAEGLSRDVIVWYPLFGPDGSKEDVAEFRVTIDVMSRWSNTIRFHGRARRMPTKDRRAWSGTKSFYARGIVKIADPETGIVTDVEGYLEGLARMGSL